MTSPSRSLVKLFCVLVSTGLLLGLTADGHAEAVLLADPAADAIYFRSTEEGPGPAHLLSGNVSIRATYFEWLDNRRAVFAPEGSHALVEVDLDTVVMRTVAEDPESMQLVALDTGPAANTITALYLHDSVTSPSVVLMGAAMQNSDWKFEEIASIPMEVGSARFSSFDCLALGNGGYVVLAEGAGPHTLTLLAPGKKAGTFDATNLSVPSSPSWLSRGGGDTWYVLPRAGEFLSSTAYQVHDGTGDLLRTEPSFRFNTQYPWISQLIGSPGLAGAVTNKGLFLMSNPAIAPVDALNVFPSTADGKTSPALDFSAAHTFLREGTSWHLYDPDKGFPVSIDADDGTIVPRFSLQRGDGPAFSDIADVLVTKSGEIYVLDSLPLRVRILRIDRGTGNRTVVADVPWEEHLPMLFEGGDGALIVAMVGRPYTSFMYSAVSYLEEIFESDESGEYSSRRTEPSVLYDPPLDVVPAGGDMRLTLSQPNGAASVQQFSEAAGLISVSPNYSTDVFPSTGTGGFVGSVELPGSPDVLGARQIGIRLWGSYSVLQSVEGYPLIMRDPSGNEYVSKWNRFWQTETSPPHGYFGSVIDLPDGGVPGNWQFQFGFNTPPTNSVLEVTPIVAPKAQRFFQDLDDQTWLVQSFPAELLPFDREANAVLSRVPVTGEGFDANQIEDTAISVDGKHVWASMFDGPQVAHVDLETGVGQLLITGRPIEMNEELLGLPSTGRYRVAVYPGSFTAGIKPTGWRLD